MSIFNRVYDNISNNKRIRDSGNFVCIPWNLPRLSAILPGVQRAKYQIVTANSKVGKTQLGDFLFLHQPYEFYLNNPNANIKPKIFYFSLEMSKESKIMSVLSYKLFKDHKISKSPEDLLSVFQRYTVDDELLRLIESYQSFFEEFEKRVIFHDHIRNPFGIFKEIENYAEANGEWTYKDIDWRNEDNNIVKKRVKDFYTPNDPEEVVIVITDHVSLLYPEKQQTLHQAMSKFSSEYCLYMRDKYKYCIVNIQQQSADSEKQQFTMRGDNIVDKLRPSADGLADNKLTGRDCNLMIGLFDPHRYKIENYANYDIVKMKGFYRELSIILNRDGKSNMAVDLFFDGASNYFAELPKSSERDEINRMYEYVKTRNV